MLPAPLQRLFAQPGHRFALLVVLGLAVIAAPLTEAWRRHGLETQTALDARRALESVSVSVKAQRALAAHRPYAAAVLAGRSEQEPERLRRQQAVDSEVGALVATLEANHLHRALDEADQLRNDWTVLLERIGRRQATPAASDAAHDLLVEQVFVIMDLATGASGLQGQVGRAFAADEMLLATRTLPRLIAALAGSSEAAEGKPSLADASAARAKGVHAPARRAARAAADLLARLDAASEGEAAPDPALVRALVALRQSSAKLTEPGAPTAAAVGRAWAAGIEANAALVSHLDARLEVSLAAHQQERMVVAAAGLLAMLIGAVAAALAMPGSPAPRPGHTGMAEASSGEPNLRPAQAGPASGGAESQGPTSDLLLRLRRREADPEVDADQPR